MRLLQMPGHTARDAYRVCISRIRDDDLQKRLAGLEDNVVNAATSFDTAVRAASLHSLNPAAFAPRDEHDHKELPEVYKKRMAQSGAPGRPIYDELRTAPSRCPLCDHREVTTLDHHLPKSKFSLLSVAPINLVPACSDCNKAKRDSAPRCAEEQTLHPYYDDIGNDRWLSAEVIEQEPAVLRFFVQPPLGWTDLLAARVRYHFDVFGLAALYGAQAATILAGIKGAIRRQFAMGGSDEVRFYLQDLATSWEQGEDLGPNHWASVTYRTLAESDWFCSVGCMAE
ncbi:HNH endonuclease [Streptomyces sp. 7R007]